MLSKRRIMFITYPGAALIDFAGPAGVFSVVNELLNNKTGYDIQYLSSTGGLVKLNTGLEIQTCALADVRFKASDTVLVTGAPENALLGAMQDKHIQYSLKNVASICIDMALFALARLFWGHRACWMGESLVLIGLRKSRCRRAFRQPWLILMRFIR